MHNKEADLDKRLGQNNKRRTGIDSQSTSTGFIMVLGCLKATPGDREKQKSLYHCYNRQAFNLIKR
jgi:hypothetical protein